MAKNIAKNQKKKNPRVSALLSKSISPTSVAVLTLEGAQSLGKAKRDGNSCSGSQLAHTGLQDRNPDTISASRLMVQLGKK